MRNVNQDLFRLQQPNLLRFRPAGDAIRAISGICYRLWMIEIRGYIDTQGRSPYFRVLPGSSPITDSWLLRKRTRSQGPILRVIQFSSESVRPPCIEDGEEGVVVMGPTLWSVLESVPDHRDASGRRYRLASVLAIGIAAVLAGRDSLAAIFRWGRKLDRDALQLLGIDRPRAPCHAAYHYIFRSLDVAALERALAS